MLIYEKVLNFRVFNFLNIVENNKIVNKSCVLALKIKKNRACGNFEQIHFSACTRMHAHARACTRMHAHAQK